MAPLLLLFPISSLLLDMRILNYFVIQSKVMMNLLVIIIPLLLIFIENMLLKCLIFRSSTDSKSLCKLHHMRRYKMKDLVQLKPSSSELRVLNSTILSFMLGKMNPSLVELLFRVPVSILPLLLHAGIHHSTPQPLQNHIFLRCTLFLFCQ